GLGHQGARDTFARAAMVALDGAAALRNEAERAGRIFEEALGPELRRRLPGARVVVGAEEVEHRAASGGKAMPLPFELATRAGNHRREERIEAAHLLHQRGELDAVAI